MDLYKLDKIFWTPLRWFVLNCIRYNFLKISVFFIIFFTKQLNDIINSKNHYYFFNFLEGSIDHRFKNLLSQYFLCQVK